MSDRLRLAVVGTLHPHSRLFQETMLHLDEIEVVGFYQDEGAPIAAFNHLPAYDSVDALLSGADFDAALVTLPNDRTVEAIAQLASAKKHILCDKPVCRTAQEMREIAAEVEKNKVCFTVAYQNRLRPVHRKAKELIRRGVLGRLFAMHAHMFTTDVGARGPDHYLFDRETSGGGIVSWLGCHLIDMMRDLVGEEITAVSSSLGTLGEWEIDVEDTAVLSLQFSSGTVASILAGYTMPIVPDQPYRDSPKDTLLVAWGSGKKLESEPLGTALTLTDFTAKAGEPSRMHFELPLPPFPGYDGFLGRELVLSFYESVRFGRPPVASCDDALRVLEVLDSVYRPSR